MEDKMLTEGDDDHVCRRALQILREHGLAYEVADREDFRSINETFRDYGMPFEIFKIKSDWLQLFRTER
jgi:hypothetical protein